MDKAAQAWRLFHLRHAAITRVDIAATGQKHIIYVGAAGHIAHDFITWNNISGEDASAYRGGAAERHKFGGRMMVLVRHSAVADLHSASRSVEAAAAQIKGFTGYMCSRTVSVVCTEAAQHTASVLGMVCKQAPQILPDSITEHPEAAFLQFFQPPEQHSRDTIVMVAEDGPILYWLLRALHMDPAEAKIGCSFYRIGQASIALVNIKSNGSTKVIAVGDTGHLPVDLL